MNASIRMVRDESVSLTTNPTASPYSKVRQNVDHDAERQRLHAEAKQEPVVDAEGTVRGGHPCIGEDETGRGYGSAITIADCTTAPVFP